MLYCKWIGEPDKPAMVLLHGLFGMGDNLMGLAKVLSAHFHVLLLDLPNHGASSHLSMFNYLIMAAEVKSTLSTLGISQYHLFGHSMGGKVAMQLTQLDSDAIQSLIIADIAPVDYLPHHNEIIEQMLKVDNAQLKTRKEVDLLLAESIDEPFFASIFNEKYAQGRFWMLGLEVGYKRDSKNYSALCRAPKLSAIFKKPTLFIKGELSDYILESHKSKVITYFPKAKLKIIHGAGHWLHFDKPLVFNRIVEQFLLE